MCLGIPAQIVAIHTDNPDLATVDVNGVKRTVNIGILERGEVAAGDWVLLHVGFAMAKMDEAEARAALEFLESMGQAYRDELDALTESRIE
jgi:hydrogenase expression/formation protein HypC